MLVSYQWLADYIDLSDVTPEDVAERLTRAGVEVDRLHRYHDGIDGVVVGEVLEVVPHPEAKKLTVCQVDTGDETQQIICGADNVKQGQKVAVALPGTTLPGDKKIEETVIRGESSAGMICALDELGFSDHLLAKTEQDQIVELPSDTAPGLDALEILGLNDVMMELDLTPNRPDCLNMIGIAYELSALLDRPIHYPDSTHGVIRKNAASRVSVEVINGEDVPYYGAKVIDKVTVAASPLWLQTRLMAAGIRPINNIVDITNFVLLEYGQPLHAFDYDRFGSDRIVTRRAKQEEKIQTLDGQERTLSNEDVLITNGEDPVALAGVMGGASAEVHAGTTSVLLETAQFDALRVRQTSRRLGLSSESSQRFEKGLDFERTPEAAERAAALLEEIAGGVVLKGTVEEGALPEFEQEVHLNLGRLNMRLGTALGVDEVEDILQRLGLIVTDIGDEWRVRIPSRRLDITIEEDLIEEVARLYGYDRIPTTLPVGARSAGALTNEQKRRRKIRRFLESAGLQEAITYSLTSAQYAEKFVLHQGEENMRMLMPMSEERAVLRRSLIPHLLDAAHHNVNRQIPNISLFELGAIFEPDSDHRKQPEEHLHVAGVLSGQWFNPTWNSEEVAADFYVVKGIVEGLLQQVGKEGEAKFRARKREGMHPGRSADVIINGEVVGFLGQIHPLDQEAQGLSPTYVFELDAESLLTVDDEVLRYQPLPRFPTIRRDLAVVVDVNIVSAEVEAVIVEAAGKWLEDIYLFDVYEGEKVESDKKSLAYSLLFLNRERTLTDEDIASIHEDIVTSLRTRLGATLRE
ncbi:phenylalanine--tRNA ligase subunit beta [Natribacillus halophilus]|uniref:Phenylalanine--tRNA ligase beta subunit n=1 Tax=Natribacillus halophilus TaxID=549003 RepID=A0A1G8LV18_9BACI|nr:phenylalanine--tRNA ligase subunit beta [Natribacillus halophilus]SDI59562.1 phenylalanyl-tRNA synthetase beta subunit [Natribacillus halophilus]